VFERFLERANLPAHVSPRDVVNAVQAIPYGRPTSRTPQGVLVEWRGTCSTKHALLAQLLGERWPHLRPRLVHRVYRAERADIQRRHGAQPRLRRWCRQPGRPLWSSPRADGTTDGTRGVTALHRCSEPPLPTICPAHGSRDPR
jgi:hypothetical protein